MGWDQCPWWGAEEEERFLHPGKPPHQWGDQLGHKGNFRGSKESTATSLWQASQSETYTDGPRHSPARPSLRHVSATAGGGWVLERGVWRADPGRGLLLAARRQPEGMGVRNSATGNVRGRSLGHHRSEASLLSGT